MNKSFGFEDRIATVSLLSLGSFVSVRGLFWVVKQDNILVQSNFYEALHDVMPIWSWGIILIVFGLCIVLSSATYGHKKQNDYYLIFLLVGGTGSAIIHFLMASASLYNATNWLTTVQFIILTGWLGFIGFLAGVQIYARR